MCRLFWLEIVGAQYWAFEANEVMQMKARNSRVLVIPRLLFGAGAQIIFFHRKAKAAMQLEKCKYAEINAD
ncbi:MAG: hypothetical protein ACO1NW_15255 [Chitinophagaceae bacterium]